VGNAMFAFEGAWRCTFCYDATDTWLSPGKGSRFRMSISFILDVSPMIGGG